MGCDFNQDQRDKFHEIYRDVQKRAEAKHDNKRILPRWEYKTTFPEQDDFLLNVMNNDKFLADKHIMIHYLLCTQEVLTTTADIPSGLSRLEVRAL